MVPNKSVPGVTVSCSLTSLRKTCPGRKTGVLSTATLLILRELMPYGSPEEKEDEERPAPEEKEDEERPAPDEEEDEERPAPEEKEDEERPDEDK